MSSPSRIPARPLPVIGRNKVTRYQRSPKVLSSSVFSHFERASLNHQPTHCYLQPSNHNIITIARICKHYDLFGKRPKSVTPSWTHRRRGADFGQASLVGFQAPLVRLLGYSGRRVRRASSPGWVGGPSRRGEGGPGGRWVTRASSPVALAVAPNLSSAPLHATHF